MGGKASRIAVFWLPWPDPKSNGSEIEDEEYNNNMNELWKRLQETHKLSIVK